MFHSQGRYWMTMIHLLQFQQCALGNKRHWNSTSGLVCSSKVLGPALLTPPLIGRDSKFEHRNLGIERNRFLELVSQVVPVAHGIFRAQVVATFVPQSMVQPSCAFHRGHVRGFGACHYGGARVTGLAQTRLRSPSRQEGRGGQTRAQELLVEQTASSGKDERG